MSVAFVREESAEAAAQVDLPERVISPHPNFVTRAGLDGIGSALAQARALYETAQKIEDINERRRASEHAARHVRYFSARIASAQLMPEPASHETVAFGSRVTFMRNDGRQQSFKIVGEYEAEPAKSSISWVSPVARALMGKAVRDTVTLNGGELEISGIG